jgi:hypothetical protein
MRPSVDGSRGRGRGRTASVHHVLYKIKHFRNHHIRSIIGLERSLPPLPDSSSERLIVHCRDNQLRQFIGRLPQQGIDPVLDFRHRQAAVLMHDDTGAEGPGEQNSGIAHQKVGVHIREHQESGRRSELLINVFHPPANLDPGIVERGVRSGRRSTFPQQMNFKGAIFEPGRKSGQEFPPQVRQREGIAGRAEIADTADDFDRARLRDGQRDGPRCGFNDRPHVLQIYRMRMPMIAR